jgi:hypothetical protein
MFIPDLGSGFVSIPDPQPGSRGQKNSGSRILICNTAGKKVQKMNKGGISWRANITSFVAFLLCCELCRIISQTGLFPQPQLDRVLEWLNAKTKGGCQLYSRIFLPGVPKSSAAKG